MDYLKALDRWLEARVESETLEFKEAKFTFDKNTVVRYCVAIANERGGHLILGVTDRFPREIVGTQAFALPKDLNELKYFILQQIHLRVNIEEVSHPNGRVLVFMIPSRPIGTPVHIGGSYLMRSGESLVPMSADKLKSVFAESNSEWMAEPAIDALTPTEVVAILDTQKLFELLNLPYPDHEDLVVERLASLEPITSAAAGWALTNLGAILGARKLSAVSREIALRAPRFVLYSGISKAQARDEYEADQGLAVGFSDLVERVSNASPQNHLLEDIIRTSAKVFPVQALRELIANALIHQDFSVTGARVMIEMYDDRVEISNPGLPSIDINRFIDEYRSRNERLADLMRRMGICEERGSGIDKVILAAEQLQLPAPEFRIGELRTTAILFGSRDFENMSRADRIRACYQHCSIVYVTRRRMTNQSLRTRFGLSDRDSSLVSSIIAATKEASLITLEPSASGSTRYARYIPFWAAKS